MATVTHLPTRAGNSGATKPRRAFAYLRVSTDAQDASSQKVGIVDYARAHGLVINEWFEETASGSLDAAKRILGQKLLPRLPGFMSGYRLKATMSPSQFLSLRYLMK